MSEERPTLTVLMPCLNEARTLAGCVQAAWRGIEAAGVAGEVLVTDNGSDDGSPQIAERCGARVVHVPVRGYGAALRAGIEAAEGEFVVMGDSDGSYDFNHIPRFTEALAGGADLVLGNRFRGGVAPGAMPWLHRYLGNPVLSWIGRRVSGTPLGDFHCGLRGARRSSLLALRLQGDGMEYASEMILRAAAWNLVLAEVPTTLQPDGRDRPPHLRTWRDGWRHLRLLLLLGPRWLYLYPGLALMAAGALAVVALAGGPVHAGRVTLDVHTMVLGAAALSLGLQAVLFAVIAEAYGTAVALWPPSPARRRSLELWTVERALLVGGGLVLAGLGMAVLAVGRWAELDFGPLDVFQRKVILAASCMVTGTQIASTGFLVSLIRFGMERLRPEARS